MGDRQQCALREDCDKCHHWDSYCKVKVPPRKSKLDNVCEMENTAYRGFVCVC